MAHEDLVKGVARFVVLGQPSSERPVHAGMGIVINKQLIATCAHVLNAALRAPSDSVNKPDQVFPVLFPFADGVKAYPSVVLNDGWFPEEDIAVVRLLNEEIPPEVGIASLAHKGHSIIIGEKLSAWGVAENETEGHNVSGLYSGPVGRGRRQIDGPG